MAYLVTGGAGFIGSHLVDKLVEYGSDVVVIDDFSSGKEENLSRHKNNARISVYKRDVCADLTDIFKKRNIKIVFHLAALAGIQFSLKNPIKTHQINVNGTLNILYACKKFKVKRLIFISSASIYGDQHRLPVKETLPPHPISPYAAHKLIGEYYCKLFYEAYGLETISLRCFNVFGPRQSMEKSYASVIPKFIGAVKQNRRLRIYKNGKQTRDFIYVLDVVDAIIRAANIKNKNCIGEVFNIGSGKSFSINEVAQKIIALSQKNIKPVYGPMLKETQYSVADISKAKRFLDWRPAIPFEEGLKKTYNTE